MANRTKSIWGGEMSDELIEAQKLLGQNADLQLEWDTLERERRVMVDRRCDTRRHASAAELGAIEAEFVDLRSREADLVRRMQEWRQKWDEIDGSRIIQTAEWHKRETSGA
jgi:hypothetical protein